MSPPRIAYLSTYPPRMCGIATFTRDLRLAVGEGDVVAVHRPGDPDSCGPEVRWRIRQDERSDYSNAAHLVSAAGTQLVSIQHEYGIYGGPDGSDLLDFVDASTAPVALTLHTVLTRPSHGQHLVLSRLVERAGATVVMSMAAARLLHGRYGASWNRIRIIPHGVPEIPLVDPDVAKAGVGLAGRKVILSFGLLGPGKGYEHMIAAMTSIAAADRRALFVILGATHPDLVRREGEAYRDRLRAAVAACALESNVLFVDRFLAPSDLARWLQAADIYVTPYPSLDQIVSGTLSVAMAAGKAIVSTPYSYAREVLAEDRGVLVESASGDSLSAAIEALLGDDDRRAAIGARAAAFGRRMRWSHVGGAYRDLFADLIDESAGAGPERRSAVQTSAEVVRV